MTITPLHGDQLIPRQDMEWILRELRGQEDSLEDGHSLPHIGTVTRPPRLSVSDLPPLHGPPLTVTPPCWLSPEMPRAASARVKLPPLPAAPAASGSSPRGTARSVGPVARGYPDLVPPSPWGILAADRAQVTPSLHSSAERLWPGSGARQGHRLPPLQRAGGLPLHTGTRPAGNLLGHTGVEELSEVQEEHGGNSYGDPFRGLAPCLCEDTSIESTCTQEQSSVCQEADAEPQVMPNTPGLSEGSTGETGNSSELLSPGLVGEPHSGSDNLQSGDTFLKESEEMWEEEELPDTAAPAAGDVDRDLWSVSLVPLKKAEATASAVAGEPWDKGSSELFPTAEPEKSSGFSASSLPEGPCEDRGTHWLTEKITHDKLLLKETGDASKHLPHIEAEELEQLEEDILSSLDQESPLVPHNLCSWSKDYGGETKKYSQLVPPDLFAELWSLFNNRDVPSWETRLDELLAKWEEEELPDTDAAGEGHSEPKCSLCAPLQDEEAEPEASPLDSDPCDEGHSEPLLRAPPEEAKMLAHNLPADPAEEADAACVDAAHAQDSLEQENPCGTGTPAGASLVPAQPLACSVPSSPTDMAPVPQPPAPQRWRSVLKTARQALRGLFSFSCLRGQGEE